MPDPTDDVEPEPATTVPIPPDDTIGFEEPDQEMPKDVFEDPDALQSPDQTSDPTPGSPA